MCNLPSLKDVLKEHNVKLPHHLPVGVVYCNGEWHFKIIKNVMGGGKWQVSPCPDRQQKYIEEQLSQFERVQTFETFEKKYQPEAFEAAKIFCEILKNRTLTPVKLGLIGRAGSGKTHLATAIKIELIKHKVFVEYITMPELENLLVEAYYGNLDAQAKLNGLISADLLILDELDKINPTRIVLNQFHAFLDSRYRKPMVFITNKSHNKLLELLGETIMSRLIEDAKIVQMKNFDYRQKRLLQDLTAADEEVPF